VVRPLTHHQFCLFNAAELRCESRNVVRVPMEIRQPMKRRDVASDIPNLNERCEPAQGGTPSTPPVRGPEVAKSKTDLRLNFNGAW
jgi:hypothetical protein